MKRALYEELLKWKADTDRKPLLLYGARQVGKTYLLKEFGTQEFEDLVYLNCYRNESLSQIFARDNDVKRIISDLGILTNKKIMEEKSLIFFDEVQDIPAIVASLKYFCEDARRYCVVAAGSLLGINDLQGYPFPVGKVDILQLYPMTFIEYLWACGEEKQAELLTTNERHDLVNSLLPLYIEKLRQYYYIGGMPEAVNKYIMSGDLEKVRDIQNNIISGYYADIAKHSGSEAQRCRMVLENIPSQLAKENKKFIYGAIKKGGRAKEFELAIQWLIDAGIIYKINRINKLGLPLKFYQDPDAFKLFVLDVGLLGAMIDVSADEILIDDNIFTEYKGAFTEEYVLTQLITVKDIKIAYYSKSNSSLEIDFIVQYKGTLFPIEVKAEENVKSKSLRQVVSENAHEGLHGFRISMKGFRNQDKISNVPLIYPEAIFNLDYNITIRCR